MKNIEPRVRLVITITLLISCGLAYNILLLGILLIPFLVGFILLADKKIFIRRFALVLWFVVSVALFQLFTPGRIVAYGITYEGISRGLFLASKLSLAIGYSLIFTLSTPKEELAHALDWLTMNKLELGKSLLISLKFIEFIRDSPSKTPFSAIRYAVEKTKDSITQ